jgi:hypothetical protein
MHVDVRGVGSIMHYYPVLADREICSCAGKYMTYDLDTILLGLLAGFFLCVYVRDLTKGDDS